MFRNAFQSFRIEGGAPAGLFSSGEIAAVRHAFGKGGALLLGFAPSLAFSACDRKYDERAERNTSEEEQIGALHLVKTIASEFGIQPPVPLEFPHHEFSIRTLESEEERLIFLMNYGRPAGVVVPDGMDVLAFGGEMPGALRNGRLRFGNYS